MNSKLILRIISIVAAVILLQTLYFKFTAHPDSVYIFSTLGMEPAGRIGTGILELIASILLFVPNYRWLGAGLAAGLMGGALMAHITKLGVASTHDTYMSPGWVEHGILLRGFKQSQYNPVTV